MKKGEIRSRRMCLGLALLWTVVTLIWAVLFAVRLSFASVMSDALLPVLTCIVMFISGVNCVLWWRRYARAPKDETI